MSTNLPPPELYTTILRVANLERSVEWYQRVFGLRPLRQDHHYRLATLIGEHGQTLTLRELSDREIEPAGLDSAYVVFTTPNADEMHTRMKEAGEHVGKVQDHPGVRLFWLSDPDGHPLCILQFVIEWAG